MFNTLLASSAGSALGTIVYLAIVVLMIAAVWRTFTKAGQPGWAAIIPIYNYIVFLRIVGRPWWWLFGFLVPFLNIVLAIIVALDLARSFGRGTGFAIGLILLAPIFILILGFGDAEYVGPGARRRTPTMAGTFG